MDRTESNGSSCRKRASRKGGQTLLFSLCLGACSGPAAQVPDREEYQKLVQRMDSMEKYAGQKECGSELRQLLEAARSECAANDSGATKPSAEDADTSADSALLTKLTSDLESSCGTEKLKGAIKRAERSLNLSSTDRSNAKRKMLRLSPLAAMLNNLSCSVVYVDGSSEVPQDRLDQLQELVRLVDLPQTRYTVFTSTVHGEPEAQNRVKVMRQQLESLNVPAERIDQPWLYPFELQPTQLTKPKLLPQPPTEPSDLSRGVWVCRTNC